MLKWYGIYMREGEGIENTRKHCEGGNRRVSKYMTLLVNLLSRGNLSALAKQNRRVNRLRS